MGVSGGEPLSEDLEAKIEKAFAGIDAAAADASDTAPWPQAARAVLRAFAREIQQAERYDWPEYDGTDAAHPAWWRGQEDGARGVAMLVKATLNGDTAGTCPPPIQELRERIADLLASQEREKSVNNQLTDMKEKAQALAEALETIREGDNCGCEEHGEAASRCCNGCCNAVDFYCPGCIASAALSAYPCGRGSEDGRPKP